MFFQFKGAKISSIMERKLNTTKKRALCAFTEKLAPLLLDTHLFFECTFLTFFGALANADTHWSTPVHFSLELGLHYLKIFVTKKG